MKKQRLPATSTQVVLTEDMIEATEKFIKRHWQCKQEIEEAIWQGKKIEKRKRKTVELEYILIPPDNKPIIFCRNCVRYPRMKLKFDDKDFEALNSFVNEHKCTKGKKAFSFVSTDCGIGTGLSVYCMDCGETKSLNDENICD